MIKKTVTYDDFNGNTRTEDFFFNLSPAEIVEWEMRENLNGGLPELLERVAKSNDGNFIMDTFRLLISKSYGVKSQDGRSFNKSVEIANGFMGTDAYSQIFMELVTDAGVAAEFVRGIVPPPQLVEQYRQRFQGSHAQGSQPPGQPPVTVIKDPANPTQAEIQQMDPQTRAGYGIRAPQDLPHRPAQDVPLPEDPAWKTTQSDIQGQPGYNQDQPSYVQRPPHESGPYTR
jgi:hypothetical protein